MSPSNAFARLAPRATPGHSARPQRVQLAPRSFGLVVLDQQKSRAQALRTEQIKRGTLSARGRRD